MVETWFQNVFVSYFHPTKQHQAFKRIHMDDKYNYMKTVKENEEENRAVYSRHTI